MIHKDFLCEFYLMRHGESVSNASPGFVSHINFDPPLTPKGLDQARLLGLRLKRENVQFDRVYSSTMVRAVQTTEAMLDAMGQPGRSLHQGGRPDRTAVARMAGRPKGGGVHT